MGDFLKAMRLLFIIGLIAFALGYVIGRFKDCRLVIRPGHRLTLMIPYYGVFPIGNGVQCP